jgi:hypothetical protein
MKITQRHIFHATSCPYIQRTLHQLECGLQRMIHPSHASEFRLHPEKKANGVVPIKKQFMNNMMEQEWNVEGLDTDIQQYKFDVVKCIEESTFVVCEWETGNISSSHRALNRIFKAISHNHVTAAVLILPDRDMYTYLTDRVGNYEELEPYFCIYTDLVKAYSLSPQHHIEVIGFQYDKLDTSVPVLPKLSYRRAPIPEEQETLCDREDL